MLKRILLCGLIAGAALWAGPIPTLVLSPASGTISGLPGETVGWGFTLTDTSIVDSVSITSSYLINETNPVLGAYLDYISFAGGPVGGVTLPNSAWTQAFSANADPTLATGVGGYTIDPGATPGTSNTATLVVEYELDNALLGTFDSSGSFTIPVTIQVATADTSTVPEPGTWGLLLTAGLAGLARRLYGRVAVSGPLHPLTAKEHVK
jgi:hypothetical protein